MLRRALLAVALLLAPLAAAQAPDAGEPTHAVPSVPGAPPGNNATAPSPNTGNAGSQNGPAESLEDRAGVTYGVLVLLGTLAFVGTLAYVSVRYFRERPRP